jgi:hypothetical protein
MEVNCRYIHECSTSIKHYSFNSCNSIRVVCYLVDFSYCFLTIYLCLWLAIGGTCCYVPMLYLPFAVVSGH